MVEGIKDVGMRRGVPGSQQSLERLPDETLQQIFSIVCFEGDFNHDERSLHRICSVDRRWRAAATSFPALWSTLPFIDLTSFEDEATVVKADKQLDLYLPRSGSHPLSFRCTVGALAGPCPAAETFKRLVAQCTRWERVDLTLRSFKTYGLLEPIRGHLPSLTNVAVVLEISIYLQNLMIYDVFSDAPRLRRFSWSMPVPHAYVTYPKDLHLPFSQLEEFRFDDTYDTGAYSSLMSNPSPLLKTVSYIVKNITSLLPFTKPLYLPHLEKLQLVAESYSTSIASHLDCLTLPSLKHLEIRGTTPGDLYLPVLNLLRRSGCSLDYLSFTCPPGSATAFAGIVALCPDLTVLGITMADTAILAHLVFDPSAPSPSLPKLKRLIIHHTSSPDFNPSNAAYEALFVAIRSRIVIEPWAEPKVGDRSPTLEEVVFLCENRSALVWGLLSKTPFDVFDHGTAELRQEQLETLPWATYYLTRGWYSWKDRVNVKRQLRLHRLFRKWEKLDFKILDTHKLVRHGYPRMLRKLLEKKPGETPGEYVYFYRARAERLLKKWKPYMLRDARRYLWAHYDKAVLVLKFNVTGAEDDDEELYRDLVGLERLNTQSDHAHLTKWVDPDIW